MFISQSCALCCWSAVFQSFRRRRWLSPVHRLPHGGDSWRGQRRDFSCDLPATHLYSEVIWSYVILLVAVRLLSRRSRQRAAATDLSICCQNTKTRFSKTKQFRAMVVHWIFKEPITGPLKSKIAEIRHLENRHDVRFGWNFADWCRLQNDMSTAVIWSKSKPDVEFQYGGHLGEFHGMSS